MKLIHQSAEVWQQPKGEIGIYKQVEKAARLCYKSEDKITDDSYKKFIEMISSKHHYSPFEHGTVYLKVPFIISDDLRVKWYSNNPYSWVSIPDDDTHTAYITTNYRVIKENGLEDDLEFLCEPTKYHHKRISVHITTSIGISRELNRHRCHSICEESTRYCNYSKDKFGNHLTFILPNWVHLAKEELTMDNDLCLLSGQYDETDPNLNYLASLEEASLSYLKLLSQGWKPQQARSVLPLDTKTELIHTAFEDDWEQFFRLRCSSAAHPMMQELANEIRDKIRIYKEHNYDN